MDSKAKLIQLYQTDSKHSNYQVLPAIIKNIIDQDKVTTVTRYEQERLEYLEKYIDFGHKKVLDIGGNTGYFTFESIALGADSVCHYEGNTHHSEFVSTAIKVVGLENKITTINKYYEFSGNGKKYDIVLLFNVLHHLGDDYGGSVEDINKAKSAMLKQLNNMVNIADILVLQIGFNWQGNPNKPLFSNGTKKEMIEFIKSGTEGYWNIDHIGIAEKSHNNRVKYTELNDKNINRDDSLGEFLNRPIFILKK